MALVRCSMIYGSANQFENTPSVRKLSHAVYVPSDAFGPHEGLYSQERIIVPETAFFYGIPELSLLFEPAYVATHLQPNTVYRDCCCLYIGSLHAHYGHFLVSTISRLWGYRRISREIGELKIIYRSDLPIEPYFEMPHYRQIFGALGIEPGMFIRFNEPTVIERVIVPAPSLVENHGIYREFSDLFLQLGRDLAGHIPSRKMERPVYLTKHRLTGGVRGIENESEMVDRIEQAGVEIVAPEALSIGEQVALFRDRAVIAGTIGSVFHTAAFVPPNRYLMLSPELHIWSTQPLIDALNQNNAVYLYPWNDISYVDDPQRFNVGLRLHRPPHTAEELLMLLDPFSRMSSHRTRHDFGTDSADIRFRALRPLGRNLALGCAARQSSLSEWSRGATIAEDAAGGISGTLAGDFQFHTDLDDEPWWEVDLGAERYVHGLVLYNREDGAQERAFGIGIRLSSDGEEWQQVFTHDGQAAFGGRDGEPLIWNADRPLRCRFVRLVLPGPQYLHLDQVEVFGRAAEDLDDLLDAFQEEGSA